MALRHICIIPIKAYSERIPQKNFRLINPPKWWGDPDPTPLHTIFPSALLKANCFDKIVIDTDSPLIHSYWRGTKIQTIERVKELASNTANGNSLLRYHVDIFPDYNVYWQAFVTSPYITPGTVEQMVRFFEQNIKKYDSIATVEELKGAFWDCMMLPINHRPELMPRSQDLPPIYKEVCGLFGVTKSGFHASQTRFGTSVCPWILPKEECMDIDWPSDLQASGG